MAKAFKLNYSRWAKEMPICCPGDTFRLSVDTDDVNRYEVAKLLGKALAILNDHWDSEQYAHLGVIEPIPDDLYDDANDAEWDRRYEAGHELLKRLGEKESPANAE